MATLRVQLNML